MDDKGKKDLAMAAGVADMVLGVGSAMGLGPGTAGPARGIKDDGLGAGNPGATVSPKVRWDLLPWLGLLATSDVLTYGAVKYSAGNWRSVDEWRDRYFRAAVGHLASWFFGEVDDKETGLPHLAHAACCVLFLLEGEMTPEMGGKIASYLGNHDKILGEAVRRAMEYKEKARIAKAAEAEAKAKEKANPAITIKQGSRAWVIYVPGHLAYVCQSQTWLQLTLTLQSALMFTTEQEARDKMPEVRERLSFLKDVVMEAHPITTAIDHM